MKNLKKFYLNRFCNIEKDLKNNININLNEIDKTNVFEPFLEDKKENIIMIIGEAPGSREVELKKTFCGPSGRNLSILINKNNLNRRTDFIITNAFPFRTFTSGNNGIKNRTPNKEELKIGSSLLVEELKIVKPKIILLLGGSALKAVQYIPEINKHLKNLSRNEFKEIELYNFKTIIIKAYHPSPLVYNQKSKKEDLNKTFQILSKKFKIN